MHSSFLGGWVNLDKHHRDERLKVASVKAKNAYRRLLHRRDRNVSSLLTLAQTQITDDVWVEF